MTNRTTLIADASWCPETGAGGWAVWITTNRGDDVLRSNSSGFFKKNPSSAQEAEVWALENGIHLVRKIGGENILAQSDCTGALHSLARKYPAINFRHVKGHTKRTDSRSWVNRWCDTHAKRQMKKKRKQLL